MMKPVKNIGLEEIVGDLSNKYKINKQLVTFIKIIKK